MGHLVARHVRLLAPLTPLTRYEALCFAMLALLAHSVHGLAHLLHSLPRGTVEIFEYESTLLSRFTGTKAFFIFTRNTPLIRLTYPILDPSLDLLDLYLDKFSAQSSRSAA